MAIRTTRSGRAYAQFSPTPLGTASACGFDVRPALKLALAQGHDGAADWEEGDAVPDWEEGDVIPCAEDAPHGVEEGTSTPPSAGAFAQLPSPASAPSSAKNEGRGSSSSADAPHCRKKRRVRSPDASSSNPSPSKPRARQKIKRAKDRQATKEHSGHIPRPKSLARYVLTGGRIVSKLSTLKLPAASGGYTAVNSKEPAAKRVYTPADLDAMGFKCVKRSVSDCTLVHDESQNLVAVLPAIPRDPDYLPAAERVYQAIAAEGRAAQCNFARDEKVHRRGRFPAINTGVTMGMGSQHPVNLDLGVHAPMVERLLQNPDVQRMAHHASALFQSFAPNVYGYYAERLVPLMRDHPHLKRNFPRSIYPCACFNFGPKVCTFKHRDTLNCPFGFCAIQSLGNFDHTKGGHIILWDLKIYIEFPPGSIALILSAVLVHSNTPIMPGEERGSFTQYCGGGLFRYVDNGYRTDADLKSNDPETYACKLAEREGLWREGVELLTNVDSLMAILLKESDCAEVDE